MQDETDLKGNLGLLEAISVLNDDTTDYCYQQMHLNLHYTTLPSYIRIDNHHHHHQKYFWRDKNMKKESKNIFSEKYITERNKHILECQLFKLHF